MSVECPARSRRYEIGLFGYPSLEGRFSGSSAPHTPFDHLAAALADRYTLLRELGQGGMATVYLARDIKHGREVAIRVLHPELAAVLGAGRFLSEMAHGHEYR